MLIKRLAALTAVLTLAGCASTATKAPLPAPITIAPAVITPLPAPVPVSASVPAVSAVDAHDGMITTDRASGTHYLIGTAYGCGFMLTSKTSPWCGVRLFESDTLTNWQEVGLAFDPAPYQSQCNSLAGGCFRPKVAQRADGSWAMWMNVAGAAWGYLVFSAPQITGPWTELAHPHPVDAAPGVQYGDAGLYVDAGQAYLAYTYVPPGKANAHSIRVAKLNADWTDFAGTPMSEVPNYFSESPGLFKLGSTWYVTYSDPACPYCNTAGTSYATAPSAAGPWTIRGRPWANSCGGQPDGAEIIDGRVMYQSAQWAQQKPNSKYPFTFNPNQTAATTYLAPIFGLVPDGPIPPQPCVADWLNSGAQS